MIGMRTISGDVLIPYGQTFAVEGNLVIYGKLSVVRTPTKTPLVIGCCSVYPSESLVHSRSLTITGDLYVCGDVYVTGTISSGEVPEFVMGMPDVEPADIADALEYD